MSQSLLELASCPLPTLLASVRRNQFDFPGKAADWRGISHSAGHGESLLPCGTTQRWPIAAWLHKGPGTFIFLSLEKEQPKCYSNYYSWFEIPGLPLYVFCSEMSNSHLKLGPGKMIYHGKSYSDKGKIAVWTINTNKGRFVDTSCRLECQSFL